MSTSLSTEAVPCCPRCGATGAVVYDRLTDRLFGAPGTWRMRRCASPSCGLLWLDPRPTTADLGKIYQGYYTHAVPTETAAAAPPRPRTGLLTAATAGWMWLRWGYPAPGWKGRLLAPAMLLLPFRRREFAYRALFLRCIPGGLVHELGCGNGWLLLWLRDQGWRVSGSDFDPSAVAACRAVGLDVHCAGHDQTGVPPGSQDVVVMSHLLEHVPDPVAAFQAARDLLRPGGRLVIVTPNGRSRLHRRFQADWRGLEPPRHLEIHTAASLATLAGRCGYAIERLQTSVRDADNLYAACVGLAGKGGVSRWRARLDLACGWLRWVMDRQSGEELVLVARKPA